MKIDLKIRGKKKMIFNPKDQKFFIQGPWIFKFGKEFRIDTAQIFGLILKSEVPLTDREKEFGYRLLGAKDEHIEYLEIENGPTQIAIEKAMKSLNISNADIEKKIIDKEDWEKLEELLLKVKEFE